MIPPAITRQYISYWSSLSWIRLFLRTAPDTGTDPSNSGPDMRESVTNPSQAL